MTFEEIEKEFDKKFDVEVSGRDGNAYFSGCHACEISPYKIKKFFRERLLEILPEKKLFSPDEDNWSEVEGWNNCLREVRKRAGLDKLLKQK